MAPKSTSCDFNLAFPRPALISRLSVWTNVRGRVPGGADSKPEACLPGRNSLSGGTSGRKSRRRVVAVTANGLSLPALRNASDVGTVSNMTCICPPIRSVRAGGDPLRHMNQVDARHHFEQLTRDMGDCTDAARCHVDLARVGLRVSDETVGYLISRSFDTEGQHKSSFVAGQAFCGREAGTLELAVL